MYVILVCVCLLKRLKIVHVNWN